MIIVDRNINNYIIIDKKIKNIQMILKNKFIKIIQMNIFYDL